MKIKLIDYTGPIENREDVTIGKIYEVAEKHPYGSVSILDDVNQEHFIEKGCFEVIEETSEQNLWYETSSVEGLPPVDTVCSAQHFDGNLIREVLVMSYKDGYVWLYDQNDYEHLVWGTCDVEFKPLKSQEEIEKEKQVKIISSWLTKDISSFFNALEELSVNEFVEYLYDSGLRFKEDSK